MRTVVAKSLWAVVFLPISISDLSFKWSFNASVFASCFLLLGDFKNVFGFSGIMIAALLICQFVTVPYLTLPSGWAALQ